MSIASRSRAWAFRALAIAASVSARLRTISPISVETRRLPFESFGRGFAGRPAMRAIAACFGFFAVLLADSRHHYTLLAFCLARSPISV